MTLWQTILLAITLQCLGVIVTAVAEDKRRSFAPRIFYGDDAADGEFPFMARVLAGDYFCGGSIVSKRSVLTAAHCVLGYGSSVWYPPNVMSVLINKVEYKVARVVPNKEFGYDGSSIVGDLALLMLQEDLPIEAGVVETIDLPWKEKTDMSVYDEGSPVTVIGWGVTEEGEPAKILQKLNYEFSDQEACKKYYRDLENLVIVAGNICTGTPPLDGSSWQGDSGGPVFVKKEGKFLQLAIVSFGPGKPEFEKNSFDVNVDLSFYMEWLEDHLDKEEEESWLALIGGKAEGVVIVSSQKGSHFLCNDGIGQNEVRVLCQALGFETGMLRSPERYRASKKESFLDTGTYFATSLKCPDKEEGVVHGLSECSMKMYGEASEPCIAGQQIAVSCGDAETPWHFEISMFLTNIKMNSANTMKGRSMCAVTASKYGSMVDIKKNGQGSLLNVQENGKVTVVVEDMTFKENQMMFKGKIRGQLTEYEFLNKCLVCVVKLQLGGKMLVEYKFDEKCAIETQLAAELLSIWLDNEGQGSKDKYDKHDGDKDDNFDNNVDK